MPRILRFINRFCIEGPIFNAAYLAKHLVDYETLVVGGTPLPHESHSKAFFSDLGVEIIEIPEMGRAISGANDFKTIEKIKTIIRKFEPDIVHSHTFGWEGIPARIAASDEEIPLKVHTYHGHIFTMEESFRMQFLKMMDRRLSNNWDATIAISPTQKTELVHTYQICQEEKTHVIPLGIDISRFEKNNSVYRKEFRSKYGIRENEIVIGIVARLAPVKNHLLFIDAIKAAHIQNKNIRAFIVGDGELREQLMLYAKEHNLLEEEDNLSPIIFTSWINKIEEVLPALDIFALTSHSEGTPVSIIEAQAAGLPVVATNVGGVKDCLLDNKTGMLVPPSDVEAMSEALLQLAEDKALRKQMGEAGRIYSSANFSYSRLADEMHQLYNTLLDKQT